MTTLTTSSMSRYQVGPFLQLLTSASGRCNDTKDVPTDRLVTAYIGCLARKHSIYVVVNIGEKVPCSSTDSLCKLVYFLTIDANLFQTITFS